MVVNVIFHVFLSSASLQQHGGIRSVIAKNGPLLSLFRSPFHLPPIRLANTQTQCCASGREAKIVVGFQSKGSRQRVPARVKVLSGMKIYLLLLSLNTAFTDWPNVANLTPLTGQLSELARVQDFFS